MNCSILRFLHFEFSLTRSAEVVILLNSSCYRWVKKLEIRVDDTLRRLDPDLVKEKGKYNYYFCTILSLVYLPSYLFFITFDTYTSIMFLSNCSFSNCPIFYRFENNFCKTTYNTCNTCI